MADPAFPANAEGSRPAKLPLGPSTAIPDSPSPPPNRNSLATINNGSLSHRSSFAENLRSHPPSPRSQRHLSFTQAAVQELLHHPPPNKFEDSRFSGRDWRQIKVGELVSKDDVHFAESEAGVEATTKLLLEHGPPNVILIRETSNDFSACGTFDYSDLTAYLLVILGLATPNEEQIEQYSEISKKAQMGTKIPLKEIAVLTKKNPIDILSESQDLLKAIEIFGSGVHRILIVKEGTDHVIGILSQWRLVKFLWDNGRSFPIIDQLYPVILKDLHIGSPTIIAIHGDKPLTEALRLMNEESLTSLAVVDNALNVVGNISTVDVRHLTSTSSLPLLKSSCIHFISVILSERGVESGQDTFPVFHVNPYSTLAHTIGKLIATRSHRMWVVESASPSSSAPATPHMTAAVPVAASTVVAQATYSGPVSPSLAPAFPSVSATALPGVHISGRLTGVVSLTDILNLFARQSGMNPSDPSEERRRRRRSSSSSVRPSIDGKRGSSVDIRR